MKRHRLKLTSLKFISSVDTPAQETATARLLKRKGAVHIKATARVTKISEDLGLVFGWALTTKSNGSDYWDLQGDNIVEEDLIKVAAAFMEAGGAADAMHTRDEDGKVVFAMPLTMEVAKAFGIETTTHGLMVAIKPSIADFAKFKSGDLTGFSIDGMGERTKHVDPKRASALKAILFTRVVKQGVLTSETDGHQHTIDLDDPARPWGCSLTTSYQNIEGAESGHSHAWTFDPTTGAITIAMDSGHDHTVKDVVPADALAAFAAIDAEQDAQNEAIAAEPIAVLEVPAVMPVLVEERPAPNISVMIAARAPAAKSTQPAANPKVGSQEIQMDKDKQIADLTTKNAELEKRAGALSKMSAVAFAVFKTLAANDAETFLAKSDADQAAAAAAIAKRNDEADKVVYLSKSTGDVYKAKDDQRLVEMAKRMDAQAEEIEKADVRKAAIEVLGGMPGDDATHDLIVRSLRKSGAKTEEIDKAIATLKGMKASSKIGKRAGGSNGDTPDELADSETALANLEKGLKEFCKAQSITKNLWTDGLNAFVQTDAGAALKHAVDEATAS